MLDYNKAYQECAALTDKAQLAETPEEAAAAAVEAIATVRQIVGEFGLLEQEAKRTLTDLLEETGQRKIATEAGAAEMQPASTSATYDTRALDALCASNEALAKILRPHRVERQRPAALRVTVKK